MQGVLRLTVLTDRDSVISGMARQIASAVKRAFKKYPYVSNCVTYGTLYVGAEFAQQTVNYKWMAPAPQPYDTGTLGRFAVVGTVIYPTILYNWYKWLDARFVGTALPVVGRKLLLDQFLLTPPLLVVFYVSMSLMERKSDLLDECIKKFVPTFKTSCMFWLPAQTLNFLLVPPAARVVYVGSCAFIWVNILCWYKRQ